ncbi:MULTISPECIES: DUF2691 family protein [unclassified Paenibacillus]|uniref:DUF2691 family protein n=1 Tax=unclassified Paenibacillus TaxID=185978 RepID=UPI0024B92C25|nr:MULTISPECIES: DUF2691 family protein [unclassified Paenibacillus]
MKRGICFEIPNSYGSFLGEILKPIGITSFNWFIGGEESYLIVDDKLGDSLFPEMMIGMKGEELKQIIENKKYYLIFANLKAYPLETKIIDVMSYEEYLLSECQLVLLVIDSVYIAVYCKDHKKLEDLYEHIKRQGFESLEYITDENDTRTRLSIW